MKTLSLAENVPLNAPKSPPDVVSEELSHSNEMVALPSRGEPVAKPLSPEDRHIKRRVGGRTAGGSA